MASREEDRSSLAPMDEGSIGENVLASREGVASVASNVENSCRAKIDLMPASQDLTLPPYLPSNDDIQTIIGQDVPNSSIQCIGESTVASQEKVGASNDAHSRKECLITKDVPHSEESHSELALVPYQGLSSTTFRESCDKSQEVTVQAKEEILHSESIRTAKDAFDHQSHHKDDLASVSRTPTLPSRDDSERESIVVSQTLSRASSNGSFEEGHDSVVAGGEGEPATTNYGNSFQRTAANNEEAPPVAEREGDVKEASRKCDDDDDDGKEGAPLSSIEEGVAVSPQEESSNEEQAVASNNLSLHSQHDVPSSAMADGVTVPPNERESAELHMLPMTNVEPSASHHESSHTDLGGKGGDGSVPRGGRAALNDVNPPHGHTNSEDTLLIADTKKDEYQKRKFDSVDDEQVSHRNEGDADNTSDWKQNVTPPCNEQGLAVSPEEEDSNRKHTVVSHDILLPSQNVVSSNVMFHDETVLSNDGEFGNERVAGAQRGSSAPFDETFQSGHAGIEDMDGAADDVESTSSIAGVEKGELEQLSEGSEDGEEKGSHGEDRIVGPEHEAFVTHVEYSTSNDERSSGEDFTVPPAIDVPLPTNNETDAIASRDAPLPNSLPPASLVSPPVPRNDDNSVRDRTTNRYKINGIIRRPCVCSNGDECRAISAFWCEAVGDENNFRDCKRAGYIRLPVYQPNATTLTQLYKNFLRLSYLSHVRPAGSSPSARWMATTRPQGKNTAEYIALHHFPREFLKEGGKGLKIESLDDSMAKSYKLTKNDKINISSHPLYNQYYAPPCYKWPDLLSEYRRAVVAAGVTANRPLQESDVVLRESTRNPKPKILCLGMSKACVESQMDVEGYYWDVLEHRSPTVQQAKELVRRNILTEMDARDLARCRAMEARHKVDAYTVSQEHGAQYDRTRHMHANFNRANFCQALQNHFDTPTFRQILLDYFWIPSGTWMTHHWSKSFFHTTLPNFVKLGLLEFPPPSEYGTSASPNNQKLLGYGVVYLPFCLHCMKQLIASIEEIKQYYKITFLYKSELHEHALWSGTQTINANDMQHFFGKNIAQEEVYCTFAPRDVFEAMEDTHITKAEVIKVLRGIEDFSDVRMIRLTPLSKYNPRLKRCVEEVGGFVGLLPPKEVQRGFDSLLPASKVTETESSSEEEEREEESSLEEETEVEEPPPPVAPKKTVRRKSQVSTAVNESGAPMEKKRKRMFEVLPDLTTYCTMGLEGNEDVMKSYELPDRKRFRAPCDIETYHFYPEPESDESDSDLLVAGKPRPSLVSKISLSLMSGYAFEKIRTGVNVKPLRHAQGMQPMTAQVEESEERTAAEAMLACADGRRNATSQVDEADSREKRVDCSGGVVSPGYLMMLAYLAEMPGVKRLGGDCNNAIESYTTIIGNAKSSQH